MTVANNIQRYSHEFFVSDFKMMTRPLRPVIGHGMLRIDENEYHVREALRRWMYRKLKRFSAGNPVVLEDFGLRISYDPARGGTSLVQWFVYEVRQS